MGTNRRIDLLQRKKLELLGNKEREEIIPKGRYPYHVEH
jgi:hypothetical protein